MRAAIDLVTMTAMAPSTLWTPAADSLLARLWREGVSASAIARKLEGLRPGTTRNAVIGRANRLRLSQHSSAPAWAPKSKRTANEKSKRVAARPIKQAPSATKLREPPPPPSAPHPLNLNLLQLTASTCRWPYGQNPYTFCGATVVDGGPYCAFHRRAAVRSVDGVTTSADLQSPTGGTRHRAGGAPKGVGPVAQAGTAA